MVRKRRSFQRPPGKRRYRKLFVVAVEGKKTEPQYFALFQGQGSLVHVKCLPGGDRSSPPQVLKRLEVQLKKEAWVDFDEAWLVVDRDQWTEDQLMQLHAWEKKSKKHGFALSNPSFEFWILLHFEDGKGITSSRECVARLKKFLPAYDKGIDPKKIQRKQINAAIRRARRLDRPSCKDWPRTPGKTTVYRLVERILETGNP
ncbi:MAG TPA: RloB domain-containing protein [Planctomycetes bacterium]|nr:RloB domain-containing protein [Planctomycetota bacterium]